jgi:general stress protein YciG
MPSYRLPPDFTVPLPGCTLTDDRLTLPFPLPLDEAHRLLVLATVQRARTAEAAAPLLGRCREWVRRLWNRLHLPRPCPPWPVVAAQPPGATGDHDGQLRLQLPMTFDEARRRLLLATLHKASDEPAKAAQWLAISRRALDAWCTRYGILPRRPPAKLRRGFACADPERRRAIAQRGGQKVQQLGRGHRFTPEEAREAGARGGLVASQDRQHMAELGRKGAAKRRTPHREESPGDGKEAPEGATTPKGPLPQGS